MTGCELVLQGLGHDRRPGTQPREAPLYGGAVVEADILLKDERGVTRSAGEQRRVLLSCGPRRVVHGRVSDGTARAALDGVKERFALEL